MINFRKIELSDKNWIEQYIAVTGKGGCFLNFTNLFVWSEIYLYCAARVNDFLVVRGSEDTGPHYLYPAGLGDIRQVIELMKLDAAERGCKFTILGMSPENLAEMNRLFPGSFEYKEMRDNFEYIYFLKKLATLQGRALHAKRNHINYFIKNNSNWNFEPITPENIGECWKMNIEWCKGTGCDEDEYLSNEKCAVRRSFENYSALGLEGGLIRSGGEVIAFTMGERLSPDTYVIHIEKAFGQIRGAYQMINREFAAYIMEKYPHLIYMNREEDMGYEGLRKAKLSYSPDKLEARYSIQFND